MSARGMHRLKALDGCDPHFVTPAPPVTPAKAGVHLTELPLDARLRGHDGIYKRIFIALLLLASLACSGTPPVVEEPETLKLSLEVRADKTAVDLVIASPVTLSALQLVITSDAKTVGLGPAEAGPAGAVGVIFDDAERVPGRLLVGLADLNQNPLPRSGTLSRITLKNATPGVTLGLTDVVAVDIFGEPVTEVEVEGTVIP